MHALSQERKEDPRKCCRIEQATFLILLLTHFLLPPSSLCYPSIRNWKPQSRSIWEHRFGGQTCVNILIAIQLIVYQLYDPEQVPSSLSAWIFSVKSGHPSWYALYQRLWKDNKWTCMQVNLVAWGRDRGKKVYSGHLWVPDIRGFREGGTFSVSLEWTGGGSWEPRNLVLALDPPGGPLWQQSAQQYPQSGKMGFLTTFRSQNALLLAVITETDGGMELNSRFKLESKSNVTQEQFPCLHVHLCFIEG